MLVRTRLSLYILESAHTIRDRVRPGATPSPPFIFQYVIQGVTNSAWYGQGEFVVILENKFIPKTMSGTGTIKYDSTSSIFLY